ncbi:HEAT repeat domain-containing protein [Glycocaulis abyssi]|uniref:HEAT repeat domain-containing protein n=1 Tax=Glycocaulis abyssi TaxID=1433403 RepID=A0ABV9ND70_9PROT
MLAIIAALSLMQAGEDVSDHYRLLSELADCPTIEICVELLERAYAQSDTRTEPEESWHELYMHVARASFRHQGRAGLEAMIGWGERSTGRTSVAERIVAHWPFTSQSDIERAQDFVRGSGWRLFVRSSVLRPAPEIDAVISQPANYWMIVALGYFAGPAILAGIDGERSYIPHEESALPPGDRHLLADDWSRLAADIAQPVERRTVALRGLKALGHVGHPYIHRLAGSDFGEPGGELHTLAREARQAALDPSFAAELAAECVANAEALDAIPEAYTDPRIGRYDHGSAYFPLRHCLGDLANFGRDALAYVAPLRPFLHSQRLDLRLYVMQTLAHLGDDAVLPVLREALQSNDWSEVYAVIHAFVFIGDGSEAERIGMVAESHWLPFVREAAHSLTSFQVLVDQAGRGGPVTNLGASTRGSANAARAPSMMSIWHEAPRLWSPQGRWFSGTRIDDFTESCRADGYRYRDAVLSTQDSAPRPGWRDEDVLHIPFMGGSLEATNQGEWGGALKWLAEGSAEGRTVIDDNVVGVITADERTLIVATGLSHLGLVTGTLYRVDWRTAEDWTVTRISTLPSTPRWLARLDEERFAVATAHGLVVFDRERVIGLGHCEPGPPTDRN